MTDCLEAPAEAARPPLGRTKRVSGDGGLLFSAAELETAVCLKCNLVRPDVLN